MLDLDELNRVEKPHSRNRNIKAYEYLLEQCHGKIKEYNKIHRSKYCYYKPPVFLIGEPMYDYCDLMQYIVESLTNNGLLARITEHGILICWDQSVLNRSRTSEIDGQNNASTHGPLVRVDVGTGCGYDVGAHSPTTDRRNFVQNFQLNQANVENVESNDKSKAGDKSKTGCCKSKTGCGKSKTGCDKSKTGCDKSKTGCSKNGLPGRAKRIASQSAHKSHVKDMSVSVIALENDEFPVNVDWKL